MAMILISHRLRSLTWVDRVIVLDSGTIVAEGHMKSSSAIVLSTRVSTNREEG